jgi:hypothetical protein
MEGPAVQNDLGPVTSAGPCVEAIKCPHVDAALSTITPVESPWLAWVVPIEVPMA